MSTFPALAVCWIPLDQSRFRSSGIASDNQALADSWRKSTHPAQPLEIFPKLVEILSKHLTFVHDGDLNVVERQRHTTGNCLCLQALWGTLQRLPLQPDGSA
jgi:hypothetical protein